MGKCILRYWFEHGGTCLWSVNDNARNKFGHSIDNDDLPISKELTVELNTLEDEYHGYLDWDYPPNPSPWTSVQKQDFIYRANMSYLKLISELGSDFEVINELDKCVI